MRVGAILNILGKEERTLTQRIYWTKQTSQEKSI